MFGRRPPVDALKDRVRQIGDPAPKPTPVKTAPRAPRQALFRNGALSYGDGHRLTVVIKDLSDDGARIEFIQHVDLPDDVVLIEPTLHLKRAARVVWRSGGAAGLHFV
jgi:hypothetical protein